MRRLSCPNVIYFYDFVSTPDFQFLFLEYCPAASITNVLRWIGQLESMQLHAMLKGILNGLAYMHQKCYAHLDLKPGISSSTGSGARSSQTSG
jgi:serine/threonine protein kinase